DCLACTQHRKLQRIEPEIGDRIARFGHQPLSMPCHVEPESAIVSACGHQSDASDDPVRFHFWAQHPVPFFSAADRRQSHLAIEGFCPVVRIWPRYTSIQVLNDFPLRENSLHLLCISKLQWAKNEAAGFKFGCHFVTDASVFRVRLPNMEERKRTELIVAAKAAMENAYAI